jgi:hypothetical protein
MDAIKLPAAEHSENVSDLVFASARRQHQIPTTPHTVGPDEFVAVRSVRDLGIFLDSDLSMRTHISRTLSSCFSVLRQIRSILCSVTRPAIHDPGLLAAPHGPAFLLPSSTDCSECYNAAARLVFDLRKVDHVMSLLRDLHWLRVG